MDISPLLEPIADAAPAGPDLRQVPGDLTFERIRELRVEIAPHEDLGAGRGKDADWTGIIERCESALRERSKDLELANALTEAWSRTLGFAGLAAGLALVRGLVERYWDSVHPGHEDGEIVQPIRARHLSWLGSSESFLRSVRHAPLLPGDDAPFTWSQHQEALRLEDLRLTSQAAWKEAQQAGTPSLEDLEAALRKVDAAHWGEALAAIDASREELARLSEQCQKRFDERSTPDLLRLRDLLDQIATFLGARLPGPVAGESALAAPDAGLDQTTRAPAPPSEPIRSRADALQRLAEVAAFLRATEPHSPVSYLVERAVRWGQMPLERVLQEVVKDPNTLSHIWDTLGIAPPQDGSAR